MKKAAVLLLVFVVGVLVGAFAIGRLGHELWQRVYEDNVANNLADTIITASQLRSHKPEKALSDLDAEITFQSNVLGKTNDARPDAIHAWSLAQTYYKAHHVSPNPDIISYFQAAPAYSTEQLTSIEAMDRSSMVPEEVRREKAK